jgi:hypothetical protein
MCSAATVIEQLTATRAQLDSACELLRAPSADAVERCSVLLEAAAGRMLDFRVQLPGAQGDPQAIAEAWNLRRAFLKATKLLENAARFHDNWVAVRDVMTGGYTSRGEPAPFHHSGRVCLEA